MRPANSTKAMSGLYRWRSMRSRLPGRVSTTITTANTTMHNNAISSP
jgi:hypothetical protein